MNAPAGADFQDVDLCQKVIDDAKTCGFETSTAQKVALCTCQVRVPSPLVPSGSFSVPSGAPSACPAVVTLVGFARQAAQGDVPLALQTLRRYDASENSLVNLGFLEHHLRFF